LSIALNIIIGLCIAVVIILIEGAVYRAFNKSNKIGNKPKKEDEKTLMI